MCVVVVFCVGFFLCVFFFFFFYSVVCLCVFYKDNPNSQRGNVLPHLHGLVFSISSTYIFFYYSPSHRQNMIYHGLCYTSYETLAGTRNG